MDLTSFCELYSNGIILLEGKRNVHDEDKIKLTEIGKLLAEKMPNATFRSGNADGSDYYFSQGVAGVNPQLLQVITPYANHRKKYNLAGTVFPLDTIDLVNEPDIVYHSKNHKGTKSLVEKYLNGIHNAVSIKGAYIIRDTIKVIGTQAGIPPISVGLFYEDLNNPMQGGTGHTQRVCLDNNIPLFNQETYFSWLV
jgi:hypothetical protein